jgi:hypothetical protein
MKHFILSILALFLGAVCVGSTAPKTSKITGDYVEARTASVFAGACHYNGELVTTGRDAIAAWSFASGSYNGTDLSGVRAMAAVSSEQSLGLDGARKAELVVDTHATDAQANAARDLIQSKCGDRIGKIISMRRAPITFTHASKNFSVKADGFAELSVQPMPNNECCAQPNLVWYTPLSPIEGKKVGYTLTASYTAGSIGDRWSREGENSAFYGTFAF